MSSEGTDIVNHPVDLDFHFALESYHSIRLALDDGNIDEAVRAARQLLNESPGLDPVRTADMHRLLARSTDDDDALGHAKAVVGIYASLLAAAKGDDDDDDDEDEARCDRLRERLNMAKADLETARAVRRTRKSREYNEKKREERRKNKDMLLASQDESSGTKNSLDSVEKERSIEVRKWVSFT